MLDSLTISARDSVLLLHAAASCFMAGLIWFVQVVHYPLMRHVRSEDFSSFALAHQRRTTLIVAPAMLIEAASALLLLLMGVGASNASPLPLIGIGLLAMVWAITFGVQVPLHVRLARAFSTDLLNRLVAINWLRTALWSARAAIALWLLHMA